MPAKKLPSTPTPRALGYRMPAEWEQHAATWIAWPHNRSDWPRKFAAIPWVYADMVRHLSRVEQVNIIVSDVRQERSASETLDRSNIDLSRIVFHLWPTNRVWTRDSGPIFLTRDTKEAPLALTHWRFNAWAKYSDWKHDAQLPARVAKKLRIPQFTPVVTRDGKPYHVVLEGGSIDVNGRGLLLTTEECLLSTTQQRNPGLSQRNLERIFADYLNVEKVIWLGQGIAGDDTHGHVDDIARFVSPDAVLAVSESSRGDSNYEPLQGNLRRLRAATDLAGRKLQVVELPLPSPVVFRKQRLPASYANFYIANNLVLVPTFNDRNDRIALNNIAGLFPKHEVVGIHCGDFIWGLGAIHCMTQQQPGS